MKKIIALPAQIKGKRRKVEKEQISFSPVLLFPISIVLLAVLAALPRAVRAEIPEPDNVLYGTIALDNVAVTAARTDVIVEARRQTNGPAIASYRMGSSQQAGNFYSLRLKLESLAPVFDSNASQLGANLFIIVRDASGVRDQANFTMTERGQFQRLDFGTAVPDSDGDGLPDAWETQYFSGLSQNAGSIGANGLSALQNFIAGTNPNDANSGFKLSIKVTNNVKAVLFTAVRAEGPGYEGLTRLYTLEVSPGIAPASWTSVAGFTNIAGNNQAVTYQTAGSGVPAFFRGRITLQPLNSPATDSDGDGLPDSWETLHFGDLSQNAASMHANSHSALQNFIAGTDPNNPNSEFRLTVTRTGSDRVVTFFAASAQGAGYEGRQRFYSLETSTNVTGHWTSVAGTSNILGNNQTFIHQSPSNPSNALFRGKVWLQ